MSAIAAWLARLTGWRRMLAAVLLGALAALAMAPFGLWIVLLLTLPALVWLMDGAADRPSRRAAMGAAFATGWAFGFGYFAVGLFWVAEAFLVEPDLFAWMIPFAVTALPAGLALFWGAGTALAALLWHPGPGRIFALAAGLTAVEWLRGHVLTGFPWNVLGYAAAEIGPLGQLAAYIGTYGLTLLVVLVAAAPALLADKPTPETGPARRAVLAAAVLLVAVGWGAGALRLADAGAGTVDGLNLRIVQPSIPQREKWDPDRRADIFARYLELSARPTEATPGIGDIDLLIWPESAVPFLIEERPDALAAIADLLPDDAMLVTGALRREATGTGDQARSRVFNSVLAIDGEARIVGRYDKWHLVPFGEYLPLARWLEPLGFRRLVTVPAGFTAGEAPATLTLDGLPPVGPLVCYEAIFPGRVTQPGERPAWLLNVTNDAWFGTSIGPYQHFAQARMRAVEEGLALVRAANTGISAIIDPYGRVIGRLGLGEAGVVDGPLPRPLDPPLYARIGDWGLLALLIVALLLAQKLPSGHIGASHRARALR